MEENIQNYLPTVMFRETPCIIKKTEGVTRLQRNLEINVESVSPSLDFLADSLKMISRIELFSENIVYVSFYLETCFAG